MRVLDIVYRVVVVGFDGLIEVEVDAAARIVHVEEEARAVDGNLLQQVGQRDGVAGALGHSHGLAVAHQVHHLHQHDVETVAGKADGVHRTLHTRHMAVVVGAPDVDGLVEAAYRELVVVVGDIGGKIGGDAVCTDENFVLGLFLGAVFGLFLVGGAVFFGVLRAAVHNGAVLGLVAGAQLQELIHDGLYGSAFVQLALMEPHVIVDAVLAEVGFQRGDVLGQRISDKGVLQGGEAGAFIQRIAGKAFAVGRIIIAVAGGEFGRQSFDVAALITALGQGIGFLAREMLQIAHGKALAELLNLVAGIVDIKFARDLITRPVEYGCEAIAEGAAARVAHMHGAGGVGGNKLHVDFLAAAVVGTAVGGAGACAEHDARKIGTAQKQVDEAGARDFDLFKTAVLDIGQMRQQRFRDLTRRLVEGTRARHCEVRGNVAVFGVCGNLHDESGQLDLRQRAAGHRSLGGRRQQGARFLQRRLTGVVVPISLGQLGGAAGGYVAHFTHVAFRPFGNFTGGVQLIWVTLTSRLLLLTRSALSASST